MINQKEEEVNKILKKLKHDYASMQENVKMLQYKMDAMQDQIAKVAVQEEGMINAMDFIFKTVATIADAKGVPFDMPPPPDQKPESKSSPGYLQ